jgi:hypothetical protein
MPGAPCIFWARYESIAMVRVPTFHLAPPAPGEIRNVLWRSPAAIVSYLLEPDERHPANAWLYLRMDPSYTLETLSSSARRNVRRGLRELRIVPLDSRELLIHGVQAYCDTRRRAGLNDGTPEAFRRRFRTRAKARGHIFLGAWKDDTLAAFLSILEVDDWAEIEGSFSRNDFLTLKPNDTLMYSALSYCLIERTCHLVSNGLSSIQVESSEAGLHAFKKRVGFEAKPVHRVFVPNPLLCPFINRITLKGLGVALRVKPGHRQLRKAIGLMAAVLEKSGRLSDI